jgi:hypothetical protein
MIICRHDFVVTNVGLGIHRMDSNEVMHWNEDVMAARRTILEAAQEMLAGQLSYIEGARKIISAKAAARLDEWDPDLVPFVGVHGETEALPFGEVRAHWQAAALDAIQPEILKKEAWAKRLCEARCNSLVDRLGK